jgi:hypothetical protein
MQSWEARVMLSLAQIIGLVEDYWLVPVGLAVLYFYGTFHFNTPDYDMTPAESNGVNSSHYAQLISLAPPIFTTQRARFRRYSLRYVLLLQIAFLVIVFCWSAVADAGEIFQWKLPKPPDLEYRAIWALFALTGLLSSFPGFKDIDAWLLKCLHDAALIPVSARLVAQNLYDALFVPDAATLATVRSLLTMRDTIRVAGGRAVGSLEQHVLWMLCLKTRLKQACDEEESLVFRARIQRDLNDIEQLTVGFVVDLRRCLDSQENLVPESVTNIDEFLENSDGDPALIELSTQRAELRKTCDGLFFRMCLLTSLLVNATKFTPEAASTAFCDIGFQVSVKQQPEWHWEALARITLSVFLVVLLFNTAVVGVLTLTQFFPVDANHPGPGRRGPFIFSLLTVVLYGIALLIAITLKYHWIRKAANKRTKPQNLIIGVSGYVATAAVVFMMASGFLSGPPAEHLQIALAQLSQGVAGYFVAIYIDRQQNGTGPSLSLALYQGAGQLLATLIGVIYIAPDPPGPALDTIHQAVMWAIMSCQNGLAGFALGYLVQRFYRLRDPVSPDSDGKPMTLIGGLVVQGLTETAGVATQ